MVSIFSVQDIIQQGQKHHLSGSFGLLKHYCRPVFFFFLGWMFCFSYLIYDYTIYNGYLMEHIFSPPYLYEMFFHIMMIIFSPVLFMFIGYQDYRKTRYMTELEEMSEKWKKTYDSIPDFVFVLDSEHRVLIVNRRVEERWGQSFIGRKFCYSLICDQYPFACNEEPGNCSANCPHRRCIEMNQTVRGEIGDLSLCEAMYEITSSPIFGRGGYVVGTVHVVKDITERKRAEQYQKNLEAQLIQAQKMEVVGQFAGGIAHDFNNFLTIIAGNAEMLDEVMEEGSSMKQQTEQIRQASEKAAKLIASILAFSRKTVENPRQLNMVVLINEFEGLIRRIIGRDIKLELQLQEDSFIIEGNQNQLEQVLMNLAVNARDAMPTGGTLSITVGLAEPETSLADGMPLDACASYLLIRVSDTGAGMDEKTRIRIFEPFFTTKGAKGTGLGLATVYTIVKQHHGHIVADSQSGKGTTFRIYLPMSPVTK
ncbi:MAG: ATP-binding protein [Nitrospirota bacterium]|nr:ATP-binding protein [Nitrospirota bacterium]